MAEVTSEVLLAREKLYLRVQSINKVMFIPKKLHDNPPRVVTREKTKIGPHLFHKQDDDSFIHFNENGQPTILGDPESAGCGVWRLMFDKKIHDAALSSLSTPFGQIRANYDCAAVEQIASLTDIQYKFAVENCAKTFHKLPTEVRERIYQYATTRDYGVVERYPSAKSHRLDRTSVGPSLLLDLQLSCRYLYEDLVTFNYGHNEFYLSDPQAMQDLLDCVEQGPMSTIKSRHFGVVILDIRKNSYSHSRALAWPAFKVKNGDWDDHLSLFMELTLASESTNSGRGDSIAVNGGWAAAVKRLLEAHTVGKLVIRGASNWKSALFSTTQLVQTLSDFKGRGRITQVCKAGTWPRKGADKTLEMLKNTIELDSSVEMKTKGKAGGQKRKVELESRTKTKKTKSKASGQKRTKAMGQ